MVMKRKVITLRIQKSSNKQFYYEQIGYNGESLNTSEMYTTKRACKDTCAIFTEISDRFVVVDTTLPAKKKNTSPRREHRAKVISKLVNK